MAGGALHDGEPGVSLVMSAYGAVCTGAWVGVVVCCGDWVATVVGGGWVVFTLTNVVWVSCASYRVKPV